jgi:hypothetical protein
MKKLDIVKLEKLQGGMTCDRLGFILVRLEETGHGDQAEAIRDLLGAGYTLCS